VADVSDVDDYIADVLADIEHGHAEARLAALEQLVMTLVHKLGGRTTVTAGNVEEVNARRPTMLCLPELRTADGFELELINEEGRPW
jgi:hypothetical protein